MAKAWYVLQTASQYEKRVEQEIRTKIEEGSFSVAVTDVRVPIEKVEEIRQGKKRFVERKVWPGYVMVEMDLPEYSWREILTDLRRIPGVSGIVSYDVTRKEKPQPMTIDEVKRILTDSGEVKTSPIHVYQNFILGQEIKIKGGPFRDLTGHLKEVDYNRKLIKISVQIFGRPTLVETDFEHIDLV